MKLHEIITTNEDPQKSILYELCQPYLKSLEIYYRRLYCEDCILMVTDVMNAAQYVKFVPESNFIEAIDDYLNEGINYGSNFIEIPENINDDYINAAETINFNSKYLKEIINHSNK